MSAKPSADLAVILPAAGRSLRFGGGDGRDKLLEPLAGKAVIARSLAAFASRDDVAMIVIPTNHRDRIEPALRNAGSMGPHVVFCEGGPSRAESVLCALRQIPRETLNARLEQLRIDLAPRSTGLT